MATCWERKRARRIPLALDYWKAAEDKAEGLYICWSHSKGRSWSTGAGLFAHIMPEKKGKRNACSTVQHAFFLPAKFLAFVRIFQTKTTLYFSRKSFGLFLAMAM